MSQLLNGLTDFWPGSYYAQFGSEFEFERPFWSLYNLQLTNPSVKIFKDFFLYFYRRLLPRLASLIILLGWLIQMIICFYENDDPVLVRCSLACLYVASKLVIHFLAKLIVKHPANFNCLHIVHIVLSHCWQINCHPLNDPDGIAMNFRFRSSSSAN